MDSSRGTGTDPIQGQGQIPIRRPILLLLWAALCKSGVWQLTLIIINFKGVAKIRSESSAAPKHNWDLGLYLYVSCDGHNMFEWL